MRKFTYLPSLAVLLAALLIVTPVYLRAQVTAAGTPTVSSGFGNTPSIASRAGSGTFRVNVGTGGSAWSGVVGMPTATTGWNCAVSVSFGGTTTKQTTSTTTTVTVWNWGTGLLTTGWQASQELIFLCAQY